MQTHNKHVRGASGPSRRVVVYNHNGAGEDGKPAVIYDPQTGGWYVDNDIPLTPGDFELVEMAIATMREHAAGVEAAIASEKR